MKQRILSTLLALCMVLALLPGTALAANPTSGTCGKNLTWTLDVKGTLTIRGTGEMWNYNYDGPPWYSKRDSIKTVVIEKVLLRLNTTHFITVAA